MIADVSAIFIYVYDVTFALLCHIITHHLLTLIQIHLLVCT